MNATDNFTAGGGQSITGGSGSIVLTAGATSGNWMVTVVNTSLLGGTSAAYGFQATFASSSLVPVAPAVQDVVPTAVVAEEPEGLRRDNAFEARVRASERAELVPRVGAARAWYAHLGLPTPARVPGRALLSSSAADADAALWFKLANGPDTGMTNLKAVIGDNIPAFVRDWSVSNAADDVTELGTQFQQRSWNWHSIYPNLGTSLGVYPLNFGTISTSALVRGSVVAGGAAYYKVVANAQSTVTISLPVGSAGSDANLQLVIVRTK